MTDRRVDRDLLLGEWACLGPVCWTSCSRGEAERVEDRDRVERVPAFGKGDFSQTTQRFGS